ncbi:hypothetical protein NKH60_30755 [Mesorhizobium sp. M1006]|uniref:hypothetical protein n=1 Tax=Mesorhizobium sp. M1006 TaxID=2957048 RepID=UPI00333A4139
MDWVSFQVKLALFQGAIGERCFRTPAESAVTAAKLVLEAIFEADFEDDVYGHRPRRSGTDAIKEAHRLVCRGYPHLSL